ncbi:MAG: ABC transporter ATP-binding protein [Galactobacter sp.]
MTLPVEVDHLSKTYDHPVLTDLTLTVEPGITALLGANGAGKTTLVSILTTLTRPDSGTAKIHGIDVTKDPVGVRRLISVTGQATTLDDLLTGSENLMMLARLRGLGSGARARTDELLEQFGLGADSRRPLAACSGGIRRRFDLAASLITRPEVLFLDEPSTGLDPTSRRALWELIRSVAQLGTTILLTTQTLEEAEALAQRIVLLHQGRIRADGTAEALTSAVGSQRLILTSNTGEQVLNVDTDGSAGSVIEALRAEGVHPEAQVQLTRPSLDDAFMALTGSHHLPLDQESA